jgi:hypothetical protein
MTNKLSRLLLFGALLAGAQSAYATPAFDACVKRLCTSTNQTNCWIKAGTPLCSRDQTQCQTLSDQTPAAVKRKVGRRYEVRTGYGNGWVSDRMIMVDGGQCPALGQ